MKYIAAPISLLALVLTFPTTAHAELMRATTAGVMCKSTAALARLSMPDGASRTAVANPSPADEAAARAGGCVDFPAGNVVQVQARHTRTSLVRSDTLSGDGIVEAFTVANINYAPFTVPPDELSNAVRARCPTKLEEVVIQRYPLGAFMETLPAPTNAAIEKAVEDKCDGSPHCSRNERFDQVIRRRLVPQWAAFICRQH